MLTFTMAGATISSTELFFSACLLIWGFSCYHRYMLHLSCCSFYPLYPGNEEMSIDYEFFLNHATMPATPHILFLPSDFKQFIKVKLGFTMVRFKKFTTVRFKKNWIRKLYMDRVKRIWYLSPCQQRRFRRACASAQSRQNLRCSLIQAVSQEEPSDRKPDPWPS